MCIRRSDGRCRLLAPILTALLLLAAAACRSDAAPAASKASPAAATRGATVECDVAVWIDLAATRDLPKLQRLRALVLGKAAERGQVVSVAETTLDRHASCALLCLQDTAGQARKVIRFEGRFPGDTLERLALAAPAATKIAVGPHAALRHGATWITAGAERVVVADNPESLTAALDERWPAFEVAGGLLLSARISPRTSFGGLDRLLRGLAADAGDWHAVLLSMTRDAQVSELRFVGKSSKAARALLETIRQALDEVRRAARPSGGVAVDRITAEASGDTVALRFAGSLDELLAQLNDLSKPRRGRHGHDH